LVQCPKCNQAGRKRLIKHPIYQNQMFMEFIHPTDPHTHLRKRCLVRQSE